MALAEHTYAQTDGTFIEGSTVNIHQSVYQRAERESYVRADLSRAEPPGFETPLIARHWEKRLLSQHLLILAGSPRLEKNTLARHLAWLVRGNLRASSNVTEPPTEVLEWAGEDLRGVERELAAFDQPEIIVFPDLQPHHLQSDLRRLHRAANRHYLIVTTERPLNEWLLEQGHAQIFWVEPDVEEIYTPIHLCECMLRYLKKYRALLPQPFNNQALSPHLEITPNSSVAKVAQQLGTPDKVEFFVQLLCQEGRAPEPEMLGQLLEQAKGEQQAVYQWFHRLSHQQQIMGVALAILEGLFEDQFFATLDGLVARLWRERMPQLTAFDIHDLDAFRGHFDLGEEGSGDYRIQCFSRTTRNLLFNAAWQRHQRLILASLPVLVLLVQRSVVGGGEQGGAVTQEIAHQLESHEEGENHSELFDAVWQNKYSRNQLFGSDLKCRRLRQVVSETLNLVWQKSRYAAEPILLKLAISDSPQIQSVAAETLATIRTLKTGSAQLFQLLEDWEQETNTFNRSVDQVTRRSSSLRQHLKKPPAYVRATLALTIAYAAAFDHPDQLAPELKGLLENLMKDNYPMVRNRLRDLVIPTLMPLHLMAIEPLLFNWVDHVDQISSLSSGFAFAYDSRPNDVATILFNWHAYAKKYRPTRRNLNKQATLREGRIAVVALTLGQLTYRNNEDVIPIRQAFDILKTLFLEEPHPFIKHVVFLSISLLAEEYFPLAREAFRDFAIHLTTEHFGSVADALCDIFLRQRAELEGGDRSMTLGDVTYSVWSKTGRPYTPIELLLYEWLREGNHPNLQQMAMLTLANCHKKFDIPESEFLAKVLLQATQKTAPATTISESSVPSNPVLASPDQLLLGVFQAWATKVALWGSMVSFHMLSALVAMYLHLRRSTPESMAFFLHRLESWHGHELGEIGRRIRRTHWLWSNRFLFIAAIGLGCLIFMCLSLILLAYW